MNAVRSVSRFTQESNETWLLTSLTAVIVVLHGYSFGLAIDISCCADVRICSRDTKFSVKEVDIGLAADIGKVDKQRLRSMVY